MERTAEELREHLLDSRRAAANRLTLERQRHLALAALGVVAVVLVILLINATAYTKRYEGRIYRGVRVAGVNVGGLTREEALARIAETTAAWEKTPLPVRTADGDNRWAVFPYDLGITFDSNAAVDGALAYGRGGWALGDFGRWFGAFASRNGAGLTISADLNDDQLETVLRSWAPHATYVPLDAVFSVASEGRLIVVADKNGVGFDLNDSRVALLATAGQLGGGPATLAQVPVPAPINASMLRQIEGQANHLASQPLTVRYGDRSWTLPPAAIANALGYQLVDGQLVVALNVQRIDPFFAELRAVINKPGTSATLVDEGKGKFTIRPSVAGVGLDETVTLAAMNATLAAGATEATATANPKAPPITTADLEPIRARLDKIASTQITVTFEEYKRAFYPADIWPLLRLVEQPDQPQKVAIKLDPAGLRALSQLLATDLNQNLRNAEFAFSKGAVRDVVSSQDGRILQLGGTDQALSNAILNASATMTPIIAITKPQIPSAKKQEMATPNRLAIGRTDYSFSIPSRAHNVELAAERLNGALIAPGASFSFNDRVGEQTVANGYQEAYGIALVPGAGGGAGEYKTVNSVAGGICQVSTTLFQAIFRAGLPIEERNYHLFWVGYGASSTGMLGLDATVDDQSGLDFQFANNSGGWLGIEATVNDGVLQVALYGKDPGWKVVIDDPIITNIRVPNPKPAYDKTHDLIPGAKLMIEHAVEGFDATIRRRVFDSKGSPVIFQGKPLDVQLRSSYQASRDRYQVGVPKTEPLDTPYVPAEGDGGQ